MWNVLIKYTVRVTAGKQAGAVSLEAMSAEGLASLTDQERWIMTQGRLPEYRDKIDIAAWGDQTYTEAYPNEAAEMHDKAINALDEALTPVV